MLTLTNRVPVISERVSQSAPLNKMALFLGEGLCRHFYHLAFPKGVNSNQQNDQLPVGLSTQLVEHCTGIAEVLNFPRICDGLSHAEFFISFVLPPQFRRLVRLHKARSFSKWELTRE